MKPSKQQRLNSDKAAIDATYAGWRNQHKTNFPKRKKATDP
jgi:hypothetical protein